MDDLCVLGSRRWWGALLAMLAAVLVGIATAAGQASARTVSAQLERILEQHERSPSLGQSYAEVQGVSIEGERLSVVVEAVGDIRPLVARLQGVVEAKYKWLWQVSLPVTSLRELSYEHRVSYVRLPLHASVTGQALDSSDLEVSSPSDMSSVLGAELYHERGYRGQGVKVAVIDLGFDRLDEAIESGALPLSVRERTHDFTGRGFGGRDAHGTMVAEIVQAMAPEAELYLYRISTEVELGEAIEKALAEGAHIVNHSVAWFNDQCFYDGTGTVSTLAWDARANGILWVNSAGNLAESHYQAEFSDRSGDGYHDTPIMVDLSDMRVGTSVSAFLTWNDWPLSSENFDLVIYNDEGREVLVSDNRQTESEPGEPAEQITFTLAGRIPPEIYEFRIRWAGDEQPPSGMGMEFFLLPTLRTIPRVRESSLPEPSTGGAVFAVGAVAAANWSEGRLQPFSSRGPTNDGHSKPDLVAPDSIRSFNGAVFTGTSAAAPFVAGAAALFLSEEPERSPDELELLLRERAWPVLGGDPNEFGAGRLLVEVQGANISVTDARVVQRTVEVGARVEIRSTLKNHGSEDASRFWVALWRAGEARRPGTDLASTVVPSLAVGEEYEAVLTWTVPHGEPSGVRGLEVEANPYDDVPELDRSGNIYPVEITISRPVPVLDARPVRLEFSAIEGEVDQLEEHVSVGNVGSGALDWHASADVSWLEIRPSSGELISGESSELSVKAIVSGLEVGTHEGMLTISADEAEGGPVEIAVGLTVLEPAVLELGPQLVSFTAVEGKGALPPENLSLRNMGGGTLEWNAEAEHLWISVEPHSGTLEPGDSISLSISVNLTALDPGEYQGVVRLSAPGAKGSPANVSVMMQIRPELTVTAVDFPARIPADGREVRGTVEFKAAAPVIEAAFEVVEAEDFGDFSFNPKEDAPSYQFDAQSGEGSFQFFLFSHIEQRVTLSLELRDEEGNKSDVWRFSFDCGR